MELREAIEKIQEYQAKLGYKGEYASIEARMEHVRQLSLALSVEVGEFLDWLPWKPWRDAKDQDFNQAEGAYELIDIFFFTIDLWLALGMPIESFSEMFETKLKENLDRIERGYNKT